MDNALQTIFAVGGVILFIVFAILIALYVIESLAFIPWRRTTDIRIRLFLRGFPL